MLFILKKMKLNLIILLIPLINFAQLNSKGQPPKEILKTFNIEHPNSEIKIWYWDCKLVCYVGFFEKKNKIKEVRISVHGKNIKTISYINRDSQSIKEKEIKGTKL